MVVGGCSDPRNRHHIADGQATGVNVGYGTSILGRPMSANAAQEPDSQENWHPHLADCFHAFGIGGERLLPAKLKVSFPTFRWGSCGSGLRRLCVFWSQWPGSAALSHSTGSKRPIGVFHDRPLSGGPFPSTKAHDPCAIRLPRPIYRLLL